MYKQYTVRELIEALKQAVEDNSFLNENSPVLISDYNMNGYKYKLNIHPVMSPVNSTVGVCLFHSLENSGEDEFKNDLVLPNKDEYEDSKFMKFVRGIKG